MVKEEVCSTCGFPLAMKREPVLITNKSYAFAEYKANQCPECEHQRSGWTIKPVYEHIQKIVMKHKEEIRTLKKLLNEMGMSDETIEYRTKKNH